MDKGVVHRVGSWQIWIPGVGTKKLKRLKEWQKRVASSIGKAWIWQESKTL